MKPIKQLVDEAKTEIKTLDAASAKAEVEAGTAMFVDIRDVRELQRDGKIPGAFHAPRGMLEFWVARDSPYHKTELSSGKTLILYCASAWRSALSTKALQDMGFESVAELDGGFSKWKNDGEAIEETPERT